MSITIRGLGALQSVLKKISDPAKYFDDVVRVVATDARNELVMKTPVDLNQTKNAWSNTLKIKDSLYLIENTMTTKDGTIPIVTILNDGRKEIRPKKAKKLFIPLSKRAKFQSRRFEGTMAALVKSQKGKWSFGKDFVYALKSKKVAPTHFVDQIENRQSGILTKDVMRKIKKDFT